MPECVNGTKFKWCKGPGSFGAKCQDCKELPGGGNVSPKPSPPTTTSGRPPQVGMVQPVGKQPVTIPVPRPVVNERPPPLTNGLTTYTFYRAVGKGPKTYFQRRGFQPRVQLELPVL